MFDYDEDEEQISVLVIGANGRTGKQVIKKFAKHDTKPKVYGFCRDPTKLPMEYKKLCTMVYRGDACNADDIEYALNDSNVNVIVVTIGNGDSLHKTTVRTETAKCIVSVLQQPQYEHIKVLVVSSNGAGGSRIDVGMFGIGKVLEMALRNVLQDHDGQEVAFRSKLLDRTVIVRPTALVDNYPTGKVVQFGDLQKQPSMNTDRDDLADWIVEEVCGGGGGVGSIRLFGNKIANISSVQ